MLFLGSVTPSADWQSVEAPIGIQALVLQFISASGEWDKIDSLFLFRRVWQYQGYKLVETQNHFRTHPKADTEVYIFRESAQNIYLEATSSAIEYVKVLPRNRYPVALEPDWFVQLLAVV